MTRTLLRTRPCWASGHKKRSPLPALAETVETDLCIIGAGIAGLTTAYLLGREGREVVVLEATDLATGATGASSAHLATAIDDRYSNLERWHGPEGARLAAASHVAAIDRIEEIVAREKIACDFQRVDGFLFCADKDPLEVLETELAAARRAGVPDVVLTQKLPALYPREWTSLRFPRQAQFDPLRYARGLARVVRRQGNRIFGQSRVVDVVENETFVVRTEGGGSVRARQVVTTTNTPLQERLGLHAKLAAYRTRVVAGEIPAGTVPPALYWDTGDPYHYVRTTRSDDDTDLVLIGGEDAPEDTAGEDDKAFQALEEWAQRHFPSLGPIRHRWTGRITETIDGLAFIGRLPGGSPNLWVALGDSGMGLTHGTIAGLVLTDLIQGRPNPWESLYRPGRMTPAAAVAFARENRHVARRFLDWVLPETAGPADGDEPSRSAPALPPDTLGAQPT